MRPILLTLMLVLLLTGSGEAGEDWVKRFEIISTEGNTLVLCTSDTLSSCRVEGLERVLACEQRMREAMARLDEVLRFNHESLLNRKSGEARISLNVGEGAFQQWDRTIRDCVKETP